MAVGAESSTPSPGPASPGSWWRSAVDFKDAILSGGAGFGNGLLKSVDGSALGAVWCLEKGAQGLGYVGVLPEGVGSGLKRVHDGAERRVETFHADIEKAHRGEAAFSWGTAAGEVAGDVGTFVALEGATLGVGGVVLEGAKVASTGGRLARAVGLVDRTAGVADLGANVVGDVAGRPAVVAKEAVARAPSSPGRGAPEAVGGVAIADGLAPMRREGSAGSGIGKAAVGAAALGGLAMAGFGFKARMGGKVVHGVERALGFAGAGAKKTVKVGLGAGRAGVGGLGRGLLSFGGGLGSSFLESAGRRAGSAASLVAQFALLYAAYKMLVAYMRGGDTAGTGGGVHADAAQAKAGLAKAKGDFAQATDPLQVGRSVASSAPVVDRFGSVAAAPVPTDGMSAARLDSFGLNKVRDPSGIDFDQVSKVTTMQHGKPVTTVVPYLGGSSDGETLERSTQWWNGQARKGFVPPLVEGSSMTLGEGRTARSYVIKDGMFRNVSAQLAQGLPANARELSPADLARASVTPGLSAGGALSVGLGGSDPKAFDEETRGRVFASLDHDGSRRVTATETPVGGGRSVFSMAVDPKGAGTMNASRFSRVGEFSVDDSAAASARGTIGLEDGRIVSGKPALQRAGSIGRAVAGDDLTESLRGSRMRDGTAMVVRDVNGADKGAAKAALSFNAVDAGGMAVRGGMMVENGKATMQVFAEDGRTPMWSRSVSDPGFAMDADGKVKLSGNARELTRGFLEDPRAQARRMEGMGRDVPSLGEMMSHEGGMPADSLAPARRQQRESVLSR